jgi:hypothetical protein
MSVKSKALAAAGIVTLASALSGVGTVAASPATPRCGGGCVEVYSAKYATATSLGCRLTSRTRRSSCST